jgi:hypothetical protein
MGEGYGKKVIPQILNELRELDYHEFLKSRAKRGSIFSTLGNHAG